MIRPIFYGLPGWSDLEKLELENADIQPAKEIVARP